MKSNSRVLRGWRDFGVKATAIILTILLATQMVGTPAFATAMMSNKQASEDIATTVDDTGVEPSGTEATDTTVPDEAAGAANEPAPADSTQATEEPVVETVESATEPATETPAADPAANAVLGTEPAPAPAPAVEQDQLASIKLNLADGASITLSKDGNKIDDDTNPVDVPANEELKFTAQAAEGWLIDKVKTVIDGVEIELTADANGEYAVAAENVTDALTVKVESSEVATADDAAEAIDETEAVEEGPTVVEAEEVVADVSSPAFEGYAYVDDVVVKVTAGEGVLPEGTTVSAFEVDRQDVIDAVSNVVEQGGKVVNNALAIDVTLLGPDGNVIQPDGAVNVCFFNSNMGDGEVNVYRVADDAASVQAIGARQSDAEVQSFDVDHFSIYVVTDEGEPALATYNFYVEGKLVSTQIVKSGDTLYEPEVPSKDGEYFAGWYSESGAKFTGFGVQGDVETGEKNNLSARYVDAYYVFFTNEDGVVVATKRGAEGDTVTTTDVMFPVDAEEAITGWYTEDQTEPVGDKYTIGKADVTLKPIVEQGAWLTFESNGGSYFAPIFYSGSDTLQAPSPNPVRAGYEFAGWYADENLTNEFSFDGKLNSSTTVYAKWTAKSDVTYTILYWVENADDDGYTYATSKSKEGTTGSSITLSQQDTSTSNLGNSFSDIGRHVVYNATKTTQELGGAVIAGDGSTVVNVYFDRMEYTLTFQERGWLGWQTVATITGKYGSYIADEFEKAPFSTTYAGRAWEDTGRTYDYALQTLDRMPGNDVTFHLYNRSSNTLKTIHYYVETVDAGLTPGTSWPSQPNDSYELMKSVKTYFNYATYEEEYHEIEGFTRFSASEAGFRNNEKDFKNRELYLYYLRNSYDVEFRSGDAVVDTRSVKYEANLNTLFTIVRPSEAPAGKENYVFEGWYTSPGCEPGTKVTSGMTMPAGNMVVYANWVAPSVTVSIYDGMSDDSRVIETDTIAWGTTFTEDQLEKYQKAVDVPDGYIWRGWYTKDANGSYVPFNSATQLEQETIALYPYFTQDSVFYITYSAGEGEGLVSDKTKYADGSYAKLLLADGLTAPEDKPHFCGWKAEDGSVYAPGDYILVNGDVTVTAIWSAEPDSVSITYRANYPIGMTGEETHQTTAFVNNGEHTILSPSECGFTTVSEDYVFLGWSRQQDATTAEYAAGNAVRADDKLTNDLYGVWQKKPELEITVTGNKNTVIYDGKSHTVKGFTTSDLPDGVSVTYSGTAEAEGTNAGTYHMNLDKAKFVVTGADNYKVTITVVDGGLTINPVADEVVVTIVGRSDSKAYDGTPLEVTGYDVTGIALPEGAEYTYADTDVALAAGAEAKASQTEAGKDTMGLTPESFVNTNGNFSKVTFEVTDGYAEVTPVSDEVVVTIAENSATETYDGTEKSVTGYTVTDISNALYGEDDFTFGGTAEAKGTDAGFYPMEVKAEDFANNNANFSNVKFVVVDGGLTIEAQSIDPGDDPDNPDPSYLGVEVGQLADVPYNGSDQSLVPSVTDADGNELVKGIDYAVSYSTEDRTNVTGEIRVTITGQGNYTGTVERTYKIIPAELTVVTESASKVFDGQVLTAPGMIEGLVNGETASVATVSITAVGSKENIGEIVWDGTAVASNYTVTSEDFGTLIVYPQSIDPTDPVLPNPDDPDYPDPDDPTTDPDQPYYTGATADGPEDVIYNGEDQTWKPTVTDAEGNVLIEGEDYEVVYDTPNRIDAGTVTGTIVGKGDYAGEVDFEYQIIPAAVTVTIDDQTKVEGTADPTFTFTYSGVVAGETPSWTGAFERESGEVAGQYGVARGTFVLSDNAAGNFLASNYTLTVVPGTLTITAAPVPPGPDDPDPVTPVTPLPTPDPTPVPTPAPGDEGATPVEDTTDEAEEAIDDEATPLTAPEPIDDDATPLAANEHRDCWVHWLMLLGILVTVVYYGGVGVRRVRFSSSLQSFEDDVLGNDETNR